VTRDTFLGVHGFDFAETGFEVYRIWIKFKGSSWLKLLF
jgi:hypothetical protein